MSTEDGKKDFFISYNKADRDWAEWIAWELEEAKYDVLIQAWDFRPGDNWVLDMHEGLQNADKTILVLSPDSLDSDFVASEWSAVFVDDPAGKKRKIVPIRVRECDPKGLLGPRNYLDLVGMTDEALIREKLLEGFKDRGKPASKPPCPGAPHRAIQSKPNLPGSLPPHWNVPHNRNPNFTGRGEILESLHKALTSGEHAALIQAMAGLGGVGKTQLALEYAYRFAHLYDIVWWIRSEDPSTLASDYAALAKELGLPEQDLPQQPEVVKAVRARLGHESRWLLIFDNVNEPSDLDGYLPMGQGGHVVITSRYQAWGRNARRLSVEKWKREESVEFLLKRVDSDDADAADALAEALGDFPLALEQAAAYMDETGRPLPDYLKLYKEHQQALLDAGGAPPEHSESVAVTWEISFQQVEKESPAGADLLNLCAFFAPDDIPLDMIKAGVEFLPDPLAEAVQDEMKLDAALRALRRFSLVDADSGNLSVHRLVQSVTRTRLDDDGQKKWAEAAVCVVNAVFPYDGDDVRVWDQCSRLLAHGLASAGHSETLKVAPEATVRVINKGGEYVYGRGQLAGARAAFEQSLCIGEAMLGPDHPEVARPANNLGLVLEDLGDLTGAEVHIERSLAIDEAAYGPDHPTVAIRVNNLGGVLRALGDLQGAKEQLERALRIGEAAYGPDHPQVAIYANNLGSVMQDLGGLPGAKEQLERALRIGEAAYGSDHPEVAAWVNNLGRVLQALGDLPGAKEHYERALGAGQAAYGPDHPQVAIYANNLGSVLQALGDLPGAKEQLERALRIDEAAYGPDHPDVAIRLNNLGNVLRDLGDLSGAKEHYERALAVFLRFLGDDHPRTKTAQENLAILLRQIAEKESGAGGER